MTATQRSSSSIDSMKLLKRLRQYRLIKFPLLVNMGLFSLLLLILWKEWHFMGVIITGFFIFQIAFRIIIKRMIRNFLQKNPSYDSLKQLVEGHFQLQLGDKLKNNTPQYRFSIYSNVEELAEKSRGGEGEIDSQNFYIVGATLIPQKVMAIEIESFFFPKLELILASEGEVEKQLKLFGMRSMRDVIMIGLLPQKEPLRVGELGKQDDLLEWVRGFVG